jgi:hypothetical protein
MSTDLWTSQQSNDGQKTLSVPHVAWKSENGRTVSNARLVEWDDGSFTLMVGSDGFKVMERVEDVHIYDKVQSSEESEILVLSGVAKKQMIITPASLDARISLAQKSDPADSASAVSRPKTQITSAQKIVDTLLSQNSAPLATKAPPKRPGVSMTAAFLEEDEEDVMNTTSIKAIKRSYKRPAPAAKKRKTSPDQDESSKSSSDSSSSSSSSSSASGSSSESSDSSSESSSESS